jgi:hypothetical protein
MSAELIESLADELGQLWRSPRPSAAGLRKIARSVLLETLDAKGFADLMCQRREDAGVTDDASAILGRSLTAARVLAWAAADFVELQPRAEELVLAAFLADAALCRPKHRTIPVPLKPENSAHVAIGAAFAAGIVDVPASLSQRVARHHERSDGTGFPRALKAAALTTDDRAVAVAVRFSELFEGSPLAAGKRLHHEARLGAFDPLLTANLLWSLGGEFPAESAFNERPPERWILTDHGRRRLRIDAAHESLKAPHFTAVRKSPGLVVPAG